MNAAEPTHLQSGELMMAARKESGTPVPASVLLRVAEAADGLRDGTPHWFLVSLKAPHRVTPFDSETAAERARTHSGKTRFAVLGPYLTKAPPSPAGARRKKRKIRSVQIFYEGEKKPVEVDLSRVDAIFLSESALDKFVYPYLSRVHGVAATARMRTTHLATGEPLSFHMPWSDWP
jgi:hypothetical protein